MTVCMHILYIAGQGEEGGGAWPSHQQHCCAYRKGETLGMLVQWGRDGRTNPALLPLRCTSLPSSKCCLWKARWMAAPLPTGLSWYKPNEEKNPVQLHKMDTIQWQDLCLQTGFRNLCDSKYWQVIANIFSWFICFKRLLKNEIRGRERGGYLRAPVSACSWEISLFWEPWITFPFFCFPRTGNQQSQLWRQALEIWHLGISHDLIQICSIHL